MKLIPHIGLVTAPLILSYGCIDEFEPGGLADMDGIFVIDAVISEGQFPVRLSRSIKLGEEFTGSEKVTDSAVVYVECSDGSKSDNGVYDQPGVFLVYCDDLNPDKEYRLVVEYGGKEYVSQFLFPMQTPEIEYIVWHKESRGEPVQIQITSELSTEESRYYGWRYSEHWEVHSNMEARYFLNPDGSLGYYDFFTEHNINHCWGKQTTETLVIGTTDKLHENRIVTKTVKEIDPSDERLSYLYYIEIDQYTLRKQAYEYLENIKKNSEQTGGIFSPIPSEIPGNITCNTNSSEPVIGYVEVSRRQTRGQFFGTSDTIYEPVQIDCLQEDYPPSGSYIIYQIKPDPSRLSFTYMLRDCLDCRRKPYASKVRPTWWITENF